MSGSVIWMNTKNRYKILNTFVDNMFTKEMKEFVQKKARRFQRA